MDNALTIKTVTVLGANGQMGKNVSAIFGSFGNAKVYLVCRNFADAQAAVEEAKLSVKACAIEKKLFPKTYDDIEKCIEESDLIFESVAEKIEVKKEIYRKISQYVSNKSIIGTGTSGLSINELSECFSNEVRKNFFGIHMYNPPYNMTLCEIIPSKYSGIEVLNKLKEYLSHTLHRKVVEVQDSPAFMGNRIGFQFINLALAYAQRYKDNGGIDYMDSILGPFTGRNMAPLATADFVGLDVHKAIVDNIFYNTDGFDRKYFVFPDFALSLVKSNKLGKKTGGGLYKTVKTLDGKTTNLVFDINSAQYRSKETFVFPFSNIMIEHFRNGNYSEAFNSLVSNNSIEASICLDFLINYVLYSLYVTKIIGENIYSADDVMATGFGWIPPIALIDAFGGNKKFLKIVKDRFTTSEFNIYDVDDLLKNIPNSKYDFRPFLKARG